MGFFKDQPKKIPQIETNESLAATISHHVQGNPYRFSNCSCRSTVVLMEHLPSAKAQRRVWQSAVDAWHYRMSIPVSPAAAEPLPKRSRDVVIVNSKSCESFFRGDFGLISSSFKLKIMQKKPLGEVPESCVHSWGWIAMFSTLLSKSQQLIVLLSWDMNPPQVI